MSRHEQFLALIAEPGDECILWPYAQSKGYGQVYVNGRTKFTHTLACTMTHGQRPEGAMVAHSCGVARCFNPRHLRWATRLENCADRYVLGERFGSQKLTAADVVEIRALATHMTGIEIARRFGISKAQTSRIINGVRWRHLLAAPAA